MAEKPWKNSIFKVSCYIRHLWKYQALCMGMKFEKGQTMRLTISAYKLAAGMKILSDSFGSAKLTVPKEGYTYMPGETVEMVTLGGNSQEVPESVKDAQLPKDINKGRHAIYAGGEYESYLYLPVIPQK